MSIFPLQTHGDQLKSYVSRAYKWVHEQQIQKFYYYELLTIAISLWFFNLLLTSFLYTRVTFDCLSFAIPK